jgi:hypothetical protein
MFHSGWSNQNQETKEADDEAVTKTERTEPAHTGDHQFKQITLTKPQTLQKIVRSEVVQVVPRLRRKILILHSANRNKKSNQKITCFL